VRWRGVNTPSRPNRINSLQRGPAPWNRSSRTPGSPMSRAGLFQGSRRRGGVGGGHRGRRTEHRKRHEHGEAAPQTSRYLPLLRRPNESQGWSPPLCGHHPSVVTQGPPTDHQQPGCSPARSAPIRAPDPRRARSGCQPVRTQVAGTPLSSATSASKSPTHV
jgi:hypothetical protein